MEPLAELTARLMQYMEDEFGQQVRAVPSVACPTVLPPKATPLTASCFARWFVQSPKPRPITRLPVKLFYDMKINGTLHRILKVCMRHKAQQGWRRFEFAAPSKKDRFLELFQDIEADLKVSTNLTTGRLHAARC